MHISSASLLRLTVAAAIAATTATRADACTSLVAAKGATADGSVMVTYAADNTNLYVKKFSMGTSSGAIYEPLDMPYMILAKNA